MSKYKIIALFGEAGAGKDYILHELMKTDRGKEDFHQIISCTTRPPREGEKDGVNYHFFSNQTDFLKQDLLEITEFRKWYYGTPISSLDINKINIGVFNLQGIEQITHKSSTIDCLPIYIKTNDKIRLFRQLNRENNPDCQEICRRFISDKNDFLSMSLFYHFSYKIIENNTNEVQPVIKEIFDLINNKWS